MPFIALFFALECGDSDFALYALKTEQLTKLDGSKPIDTDALWSEKGAEFPTVYLFSPPYKNERIQKQKGLFLLPTTTVMPFEDVASLANVNIVKFVIRASLRAACMAMLAKMSISPASVYPEKEGNIRALAWDIQAKALTCHL